MVMEQNSKRFMEGKERDWMKLQLSFMDQTELFLFKVQKK